MRRSVRLGQSGIKESLGLVRDAPDERLSLRSGVHHHHHASVRAKRAAETLHLLREERRLPLIIKTNNYKLFLKAESVSASPALSHAVTDLY